MPLVATPMHMRLLVRIYNQKQLNVHHFKAKIRMPMILKVKYVC